VTESDGIGVKDLASAYVLCPRYTEWLSLDLLKAGRDFRENLREDDDADKQSELDKVNYKLEKLTTVCRAYIREKTIRRSYQYLTGY
jgi:hypothetical protein